jgi:hypothetical protein
MIAAMAEPATNPNIITPTANPSIISFSFGSFPSLFPKIGLYVVIQTSHVN